jgi:tetratricopeptide (TPR) repeat protein
MKRIFTLLFTIILFALPLLPLVAQEQPATTTPSAVSPAPASDFANGMKLYRQGRYGQAISVFESIPTESPDYAAACYFAGYAHYVLRHYPEAVASFGKAFQANPTFDPRPYFRSR